MTDALMRYRMNTSLIDGSKWLARAEAQVAMPEVAAGAAFFMIVVGIFPVMAFSQRIDVLPRQNSRSA
jgi:cell division protein FtsX